MGKKGEMGKVHAGFMKALEVQDVKDCNKGWPKEYKGLQKLACYTIRDQLNTLIKVNKDAKILVTGHSLGGALAALFPSILVLHEEDKIMKRMKAIYTFGQPRVGDETFGSFMNEKLEGLETFGSFMNEKLEGLYFRMIFRYDIVPRVPFDDEIFRFSHRGLCIYHDTWHNGKVSDKEQHKNLLSPCCAIRMYFHAWVDLFKALAVSIMHGKEYEENSLSMLLRIAGLAMPGFVNHSPRDYLNSVKLANVSSKEKGAEVLTRKS